MSTLNSSLKELDPNFVLYFKKKGINESKTLELLKHNNINFLLRSSSHNKIVYIYLHVQPTEDNLLNIKDILGDLKFIEGIIPLYSEDASKRLLHFSNKVTKGIYGLPSDEELTELGYLTADPNLSFYFSFSVFYLKWLFVLACFGVYTRYYSSRNGWQFNKMYTLGLLIWSVGFTASWLYVKEPHILRKFGNIQYFPVDQLFQDPHIEGTSLRRLSKLKEAFFMPIMVFFAGLLFFLQLSCFSLEIFIGQLYDGPYRTILSLIPTVFLAIFTFIITTTYNVLFVNPYVKFEGTSQKTESKLQKNTALVFLVNYSPLLITLFIYYPFGSVFGDVWKTSILPWIENEYSLPVIANSFTVDITRHQNQMFYFTITNQVIQLLTNVGLPAYMSKVRSKRVQKEETTYNISQERSIQSKSTDSKYLILSEAYIQGPWGKFDSNSNLQKIMIQLGFVMLFSPLWPMMPLLFLVFNIITFRIDVWTSLLKCTPQSISNINIDCNERKVNVESCTTTWNKILIALTWMGSIVTPSSVLMFGRSQLQVINQHEIEMWNFLKSDHYSKRRSDKFIFERILILEPVIILGALILHMSMKTVHKWRASKNIVVTISSGNESNVGSKRSQDKLKVSSIVTVTSKDMQQVDVELVDQNIDQTEVHNKKSHQDTPTENSSLKDIIDDQYIPDQLCPYTAESVHRAAEPNELENIQNTDNNHQSISIKSPEKKKRRFSLTRILSKFSRPQSMIIEDNRSSTNNVYAENQYQETGKIHLPVTLRPSNNDGRARAKSLSSTYSWRSASPNALAAEAATAALSRSAHGSIKRNTHVNGGAYSTSTKGSSMSPVSNIRNGVNMNTEESPMSRKIPRYFKKGNNAFRDGPSNAFVTKIEAHETAHFTNNNKEQIRHIAKEKKATAGLAH